MQVLEVLAADEALCLTQCYKLHSHVTLWIDWPGGRPAGGTSPVQMFVDTPVEPIIQLDEAGRSWERGATFQDHSQVALPINGDDIEYTLILLRTFPLYYERT